MVPEDINDIVMDEDTVMTPEVSNIVMLPGGRLATSTGSNNISTWNSAGEREELLGAMAPNVVMLPGGHLATVPRNNLLATVPRNNLRPGWIFDEVMGDRGKNLRSSLIFNEMGEHAVYLGNGKEIVFGDKNKLMIKERDSDNYVVCEGCDDLSDLQIAILLRDKEKVKSLLSTNLIEVTDSLVKFAKRFSDDKEIIEMLENLFALRRNFIKQKLNAVLPIGDLQDISLDYLDIPRK